MIYVTQQKRRKRKLRDGAAHARVHVNLMDAGGNVCGCLHRGATHVCSSSAQTQKRSCYYRTTTAHATPFSNEMRVQEIIINAIRSSVTINNVVCVVVVGVASIVRLPDISAALRSRARALLVGSH